MVKTFNQEVVDAINGVITDNKTTRALITTENEATRSKLSELESQLKVINDHLSLVDNENLSVDNSLNT